MQAVNSAIPIIIQAESMLEFKCQVNTLLLNPPDWISREVEFVRKELEAIPNELSENYKYAPVFTRNEITIKFKYKKSNYKLKIEQNPGVKAQISSMKESSLKSALRAGNKITSLSAAELTSSTRQKVVDSTDFLEKAITPDIVDEKNQTVDSLASSTNLADSTNKPEITFQGRITPENVSRLPKNVQSHERHLAKSDFPYTVTVTENGRVTVGGTVKRGGETTSLADLLKNRRKK